MVDNQELSKIISNENAPEQLRIHALNTLSARENSAAQQKINRKQSEETLRIEKLRLWLNAPFVVVVTGLITLAATHFSNWYLNKGQFDGEITKISLNQENTIKLEKRKFQYEIIKSALNDQKDSEGRASALSFLFDIGILDELNKIELKEWSEGRKGAVPSLSNETQVGGVEREAPRRAVDPALIARLKNEAASNGSERWMKFAIDELGVTEIIGPDSNIRIMQYAREANISSYKNDDMVWSGLFITWVMTKSGFQNLPEIPLYNRNWSQWGLPESQPEFGLIAVFSSADPRSLTTSAGFIVGFDQDTISILMRNIRNSVDIGSFPRRRLISIRRPD